MIIRIILITISDQHICWLYNSTINEKMVIFVKKGLLLFKNSNTEFEC